MLCCGLTCVDALRPRAHLASSCLSLSAVNSLRDYRCEYQSLFPDPMAAVRMLLCCFAGGQSIGDSRRAPATPTGATVLVAHA